MEHASHSHDSHDDEEHGHGDEPLIEKKMAPNEALANSLNEQGVISEPQAIGSHPLESKPYYSHKFALTSKFVTNRGTIKVSGRNFDLVQVLQRN